MEEPTNDPTRDDRSRVSVSKAERPNKDRTMMRFKVAIALLCAMTILSSAYAFRQRQWALKLRDQLAETNKDDVKFMQILSVAEKESACRKLRELGEDRIADWISSQYLATQNEANKDVAESK